MPSSFLNLLIHTFQSDLYLGSPQHLHFFKSKNKMLSAYKTFQVKGEQDHSFIYFDNTNVHVAWKNKAGPIQFCGSAAYALAWILMGCLEQENLQICGEHIQLESRYKNGKTYLSFPGNLPKPLDELKQASLYLDSASGIFFCKYQSEGEVKDDSLVKEHLLTLEKKHSKNIHGFCAFYWNKELSKGSLRYFTPWHGRDEDYVTGSIHQYLTPLVNQLFSSPKQAWAQCSNLGGELESSIIDDKVSLFGHCVLHQKNGLNSLKDLLLL